MKKIQIGTVRQTADVEVVFINANLIAKAIHANDAIQNIIECAKAEGDIIPRYQPKLNEVDEPVTDERGCIINEPVLDDKGNHITDYCKFTLDSNDLMRINTQVATFLKELVDAFEA